MNRFLYAEANPTTFIDPTGHWTSEFDPGTGAGAMTGCHNIGDYGCGKTAPTSKSTVRARAPRPKQIIGNRSTGTPKSTNNNEIKDKDLGPINGGAAPSRSVPGGGITDAVGNAFGGVWDAGSNWAINAVGGTWDQIACGGINAYNPVSCGHFDENIRSLTDPDFAARQRQAELYFLANAVGDAQRNLTSGDPYRTARAVTDIVLIAAAARGAIGAVRAGAAGAGMAEASALTRLRFGASDLVYGPSAEGRLEALQAAAGGRTLSQLAPAEGVEDWNALSIDKMVMARQSGSKIHFDLTNVADLPGVLDGSNPLAFTYTGQELSYLRANWSRFQGSVTFYMDVSITDGVVTGRAVPAPWGN
jgi:hypothetical protein